MPTSPYQGRYALKTADGRWASLFLRGSKTIPYLSVEPLRYIWDTREEGARSAEDMRDAWQQELNVELEIVPLPDKK